MQSAIVLIYILMAIAALSSCTYSITMVHTEGTATDVVDTEQRADPKTDATLSIPAGAL